MFLLDGKRLQPGTAFTHNNIQYPANWLNHASLQEKLDIGITEVSEQSRPDDRFYWVTDNGDGTYGSTPKQLNDKQEEDEDGNPLYVKVYDPVTQQMVDSSERLVTTGLKSQWIKQLKNTVNTLLFPSDWMVTRKFERNINIPQTVAEYRTAIITEMDRLESAIGAVSNIEELITVIQSVNWPTPLRDE